MEKWENKENSIYTKEDWKRDKEKRDSKFFKRNSTKHKYKYKLTEFICKKITSQIEF